MIYILELPITLAATHAGASVTPVPNTTEHHVQFTSAFLE